LKVFAIRPVSQTEAFAQHLGRARHGVTAKVERQVAAGLRRGKQQQAVLGGAAARWSGS
jgi:hypothetical protein